MSTQTDKIRKSQLEEALTAHQSGELQRAEIIYLNLLKAKKEEVILYHLGVVNLQLGETKRAKRYLLEAIKKYPKIYRSYTALSLVLEKENNIIEAERFALLATKLAPNNPAVWNNLAKVQINLGKYDEASDSALRSLNLDPKSFEARFNRILALAKTEGPSNSLSELESLSAEYPSKFEVHAQLGALNADIGFTDDAVLSYGEAYRLICEQKQAPECIYKIGNAALQLLGIPIIHKSNDSLEYWKKNIFEILTKIESLLDQSDQKSIFFHQDTLLFCFSRISNFYVPYLEIPTLEFHKRYSKIIQKIFKNINDRYESPSISGANSKGKLKKIGVISEYFGLHATQWIGDLLLNTRLQNAKVTYYVINDWKNPAYLSCIKQHFTIKFLSCGETNLESAIEFLRSENLNLLIYPDVGMTPASRLLSCFRIAETQMVHWAHPDTTGSECIDYFMTSELMEGSKSDQHYSEKLLSLPNFGLFLSKPKNSLAYDSLSGKKSTSTDEITLISIQSLFKYIPAYDWVYIEILKRLPNSRLFFIKHPSEHITDLFRSRLKAACHSEVSIEGRICFVDRMDRKHLLDFINRATLCLDSIGWSGGNTCLDALEANCPVLTIPGEFMRSRHTFAALKVLGLDDLIARDPQEFVERVIHLCHQPEKLQQLRKLMDARLPLLYEDRITLAEFESVLRAVLAHEA